MKNPLRPWLLALLLGLTPLAAVAAEPIDINKADVTQLETITGIGPAKAKAIVDYRSQHGPFKDVSELENVPGIGPKLLAQIKPDVTVSAARK